MRSFRRSQSPTSASAFSHTLRAITGHSRGRGFNVADGGARAVPFFTPDRDWSDMFDELLFPTDGSEGASVAFGHVLDLAAAHDATVHVLYVADTTVDSVTQIQGRVVDALVEEGTRIVEAAADRASDRGVATVTEVLQGAPDRTIVDYADARAVDLIALPTHGRRGLERFLLGSTTDRVVRRSPVPVLTIRPDDDLRVRYPYRGVLVPTDGSDCATDALAVGVDVADAAGASIHLLSVVDVSTLGVDYAPDVRIESLEASADEVLDAAAAVATDAGVPVAGRRVDVDASVPRAIREYVADHDVDLIVVGTHGRTGVERYVLGSVADRLVRTAPVPVLTVRGGAD
jgi:nucleotide-binding universal stress UspA family protein